MTSVPTEVAEYFDALAPERQVSIRPVFDAVAAAMPEGYELGIQFGMPGWVIPLETFPETYNGKPLAYVSMASGKSYNSLYLMGLYSDLGRDAEFRRNWAGRGLKLDMGKSCLRYKRLDQVDLGLIADEVAAVTVEKYLATYLGLKA